MSHLNAQGFAHFTNLRDLTISYAKELFGVTVPSNPKLHYRYEVVAFFDHKKNEQQVALLGHIGTQREGEILSMVGGSADVLYLARQVLAGLENRLGKRFSGLEQGDGFLGG